MVRDVSNSNDVIDSRDVIKRIEELESERADLVTAAEEAKAEGNDEDALRALQEWDEDEGEDLKALKSFAEEAEGYCEDWCHGATLIRESYFVAYCQELVEDIGDLPKGMPTYLVIDWDATADNLKADYTEVDFDGATYLVR